MSLCREYYQFILAQGILGGLTNGLTYTPALTAVGHYFSKKRPLAMGIASSGASLSGVILPIALNRMLNRTSVGFGWSVRVLGFVMLVLSIVACLSVTSNAPKRRSGPPLLLEAWKNPAYSSQVAGTFLVMWAVFVPFFYLPGYAQSIGLTVDLSYYLLAILNAVSLFGRLFGGAAADRLGRINTLSASCAICGILILSWLSIRSQGGIIAFAALFGFFSGIVIAVFPATIAMTAPQPNQIGSYLGMALGVYGIAGLTGTPITGAMVSDYGTYRPAIAFAGVSALIGAVVIFGSRYFLPAAKLVA
jgi:MFS family permease